ncbi:uncharacterized protein TM35_000561120 [Trypanosoma theileri]|uniref:Uncharacterized protein n=1 Tax=Trypanosoma theileri TaxID=67003 RepID=A0A1X0NGA9_9TRYP|nr:uncharacterized protein TM35_000561120 [Trypanosoma theileri]ORC83814.1 hypothetical protein TM35_000561120 [Trypanosoma theileri]
MMSRVLCFLALVLGVVSLCVTAEASSESVPLPTGGKCPEGYSPSADGENCSRTPSPPAILPPPPPPPPPPLPQQPGGKPCTSDDTIPQCSTSGSEDEAARPDCETSTESETCNTKEPKKEDSCRGGSSDTHCTHSLQEPGRTTPNPGDEHLVRGTPDPIGASGEQGESADGEAVSGVVSSSSEPPNNAVAPSSTTSAAPALAEGSETAPTGDSHNGDSVLSESGATKTSPKNSDSGSDGGSETTLTENGGTSAEGSTSTGITGDVGNTENTDATTTTTTTTTTLPPELTNNKKGDADSSSSIRSSVWVRVPLLIVVTLACILVY